MEFPTEKRVEEFSFKGKKQKRKNTHTKPFDNMSLDFLAIYNKEQYNNINIKLQWNFSFTINFELGNFHIFRGEGGRAFVLLNSNKIKVQFQGFY